MKHYFPLLLGLAIGHVVFAETQVELPANLRVVLGNTKPVSKSLEGRLQIFVLPISGALSPLPLGQAEHVLNRLTKRGIGYSVNWNYNTFDESLKEGLRIGRLPKPKREMVSVHATS